MVKLNLNSFDWNFISIEILYWNLWNILIKFRNYEKFIILEWSCEFLLQFLQLSFSDTKVKNKKRVSNYEKSSLIF